MSVVSNGEALRWQAVAESNTEVGEVGPCKLRRLGNGQRNEMLTSSGREGSVTTSQIVALRAWSEVERAKPTNVPPDTRRAETTEKLPFNASFHFPKSLACGRFKV